jgi:putative oxidoreductase
VGGLRTGGCWSHMADICPIALSLRRFLLINTNFAILCYDNRINYGGALMIDRFADILLPIGRVMLASLFVLAGINKILNYNATLVMMDGAGVQPAAMLLPSTIALELGAGVSVALGNRYSFLPALALAAYTLATNLFFHRFWSIDGELAQLQLSLFFKNAAIIGALLYLAATVHKAKSDG